MKLRVAIISVKLKFYFKFNDIKVYFWAFHLNQNAAR